MKPEVEDSLKMYAAELLDLAAVKSVEEEDKWNLPLAAPKASPYSGATFSIAIFFGKDCPISWTWQSSIYHPQFCKGVNICSCLLNSDDGLKSPKAVLKDISILLEKPHYIVQCEHCNVNPTSFAEMRTDLDFFKRKARAHTPGADPLSDEDLRSASPFNFSDLLLTGAHSDVTVVVGKSVFRCHRTILAARSSALRESFDSPSLESGLLRLENTNAVAFARCLKYIYGGKLASRDSLDVIQHYEIYALANKLRVAPLANYHLSLLTSLVNVTNAFSILQRAQAANDSNLTRALLRFIDKNNLAVDNQGDQTLACGPARPPPRKVAAFRHSPY